MLGASEWLAGRNGSLQNLKEVFGYSDDEWQFVWSSMSEIGAWNVPKIKDSAGSVIKDNYGPEMMLRYIAHDLHCHIIIFDLQVGITQFCSANYLKPMLFLMLYCFCMRLEITFSQFCHWMMKCL